MIRFLCFDVDNTLIDFNMAIYSAQYSVAKKLGIPFTPSYLEEDGKLAREAFMEYGLNNTSDPDIQDEWHQNMRLYLVRHYELLAEKLDMDLDPYELTRLCLNALSENHHEMEMETLDVYRELSHSYKNVIATNSIRELGKRIEHFLPYTHRIFVSDEVGFMKPRREFFDSIASDLGCNPEECLMIGDSVVNDIEGAKKAGFRTCWYRHGHAGDMCDHADYTIDYIVELPSLLERIG